MKKKKVNNKLPTVCTFILDPPTVTEKNKSKSLVQHDSKFQLIFLDSSSISKLLRNKSKSLLTMTNRLLY